MFIQASSMNISNVSVYDSIKDSIAWIILKKFNLLIQSMVQQN